MNTKLKSLQKKLENQADSYPAKESKILALATKLAEASAEFAEQLRRYEQEWNELLDAKVEAANILWCRQCREIKSTAGSVYLNTQGQDEDGSSRFGYIHACEPCAKMILSRSPWYGKWDDAYKRQPYFLAYRMEKRDELWFVMDTAQGTALRSEDTSWIEISFKGYRTAKAFPSEDVIADLAKRVKMPKQLELRFDKPISVARLCLAEGISQAASA